ncbi:MAG: class II glutamine amidotransferase [Lentisphaeria bacterium]|nr:class II glutamine amidotransferase [Lentisphaeria bacterium]
MSDPIRHECAVALLRLRKNPEYYRSKYGDGDYGFGKMALLLEKQHNRGQDGAGIAALGLDPRPGTPAYRIEKSAAAEDPLADLLGRCSAKSEFGGEVLLGHLRYATYGRHELAACHPFVHESNCLDRALVLAGNFNLTDTGTLFERFRKLGHHPASGSDGYLITQTIAHYLEQDSDLHRGAPPEWENILRQALNDLDGAFTLCGFNGSGDAFAIRDARAIRPGYFYFDDEVFVAASERPAIQAAFDCSSAEVMELPAGKAVVVPRNGEVRILDCLDPAPRRSCVFERIYFSRPNDAAIHRERKLLGKALVPEVLEAAGGDFADTFFSYIPNSAQVSFHGMLEELMKTAAADGHTVRFGQIAIKDAKFRTFIADEGIRRELGMHVYDITYGLVRPGADTLVVLDDSIVRGSTMRRAILPILGRLAPRKIVVASSAPIIRYPDCYGIDMACAGDLVAFQAAVGILRREGRDGVLFRAAEHARSDLERGESQNRMKEIYDAVDDTELLREIARLLTPAGFPAELRVVYQSLTALRHCCPEYPGDWYFTGDYPTPGGFRMVNRALLNYMENNHERAY